MDFKSNQQTIKTDNRQQTTTIIMPTIIKNGSKSAINKKTIIKKFVKKSPSPSPEPSSSSRSPTPESDKEESEEEDEEEDSDNEDEAADALEAEAEADAQDDIAFPTADLEAEAEPENRKFWEIKPPPEYRGDMVEWKKYVDDLPTEIMIKDKVCEYTEDEVREMCIICGADGQGGKDAYGKFYNITASAEQLKMAEILDKEVVVAYNSDNSDAIKNKDIKQKKTLKSSFNVELKFEKGFFEELSTTYKNDVGEKLPLEFWKSEITKWAYDICNIGNARCRSGYSKLSPKVGNIQGVELPYGFEKTLLGGHFQTEEMLAKIAKTSGKKKKETKPKTVKEKIKNMAKGMSKAEKKKMLEMMMAEMEEDDEE